MLFENNRSSLRKKYAETWHKHCHRLPLEPLESQILDIILMHPEYHLALTSPTLSEQEYLPESGQSNPYLHMGLHLGLREQLQTDRPSGIKAIYQSLCARYQDSHEAEHRMMACLAQALWEAQQNYNLANETAYLDCLKKLIC